MADLSDVVATLAGICATALYPNGTTSPSALGVDCKVMQGWPVPDDLDAYLASGKIQVSIYPMPGMDRNTTRFPKVWQTVSISAPTLAIATTNTSITLSGTVSVPQVVMVLYSGDVYAYQVKASDTLASIASGIAALIPGAAATGAVVTLSGGYGLTARIVVDGTSILEVRRQQRVFKITVWAPSPTLRDSASQAIDNAFADLERTDLPDGTSANIVYRGTLESDSDLSRLIYRRDLDYQVEYATTQMQAQTTIGTVEITRSDGGLTTYN